MVLITRESISENSSSMSERGQSIGCNVFPIRCSHVSRNSAFKLSSHTAFLLVTCVRTSFTLNTFTCVLQSDMQAYTCILSCPQAAFSY